MTRIVIVGAEGRMGQSLIGLIGSANHLSLAGAITEVGSANLNSDAGVYANGIAQSVPFTDNYEASLQEADAIIDFSTPVGILDRMTAAFDNDCAYVLGTTGFSDQQKAEIYDTTDKHDNGKLIFAPNFSVGINLLLELCGKVATTLGDDYDIEVIDMHHNQKVDAPSGTAEKLCEVLCDARELSYQDDVAHGRFGLVGKRPKNEIGMHTLRGGDVVGDHTIVYATGGERIELTHKASSRDTFSKGALRAAVFLDHAEKGTYSMKEVLGL